MSSREVRLVGAASRAVRTRWEARTSGIVDDPGRCCLLAGADVERQLGRRREPAAGEVLRQAELAGVESVALGEALELAGALELVEQVLCVDGHGAGRADAVQAAAADAVAVGRRRPSLV